MAMYVNDYWIYVVSENSSEKKEDKEESSYGKWLLFFNWEESWEQWKKIAIAIEDGDLNSDQAKISRQYDGNNYEKAVCCVYTSKKDIEVAREQLRKLGFVNHLCYKTNEATEQNSYGHSSHLICENKNVKN